MIRFEFTDSSFSIENTTSYKLSVRLGMDSFALGVKDYTGKVLAIRHRGGFASTADLATALSQEPLLHRNWQLKHLAYISMYSILLPSRLYTEGQEATYLAPLSAESSEGDFVFEATPLFPLGNHLVYRLPKQLLAVGRQILPNQPYSSTRSTYLLAADQLARKIGRDVIFAHTSNKTVFLSHFSDGKLKLGNAYTFDAAKDFLYYVLLVYEQAGLSPQEVPLRLSGRLVEASEIFRLLYRYIKDVNFINHSVFYRYESKRIDHPTHQYFDLLVMDKA